MNLPGGGLAMGSAGSGGSAAGGNFIVNEEVNGLFIQVAEVKSRGGLFRRAGFAVFIHLGFSFSQL